MITDIKRNFYTNHWEWESVKKVARQDYTSFTFYLCWKRNTWNNIINGCLPSIVDLAIKSKTVYSFQADLFINCSWSASASAKEGVSLSISHESVPQGVKLFKISNNWEPSTHAYLFTVQLKRENSERSSFYLFDLQMSTSELIATQCFSQRWLANGRWNIQSTVPKCKELFG